MDKRMFQNKPVSLLGYGCMRFPTREENGERRIDRAEAEKLLDCAYAAGVNYYDTRTDTTAANRSSSWARR